jgi:hypothetical protein
VAFEMRGAPLHVHHCHCSRCRKTHGTAHATDLVVPAAGVRFTWGEELLTVFRPPGATTFAHAFCRACGSSMPRFDTARGVAIVPWGSLDEDPGVRPEWHIFVESKAPWDEILDGLSQYTGSEPIL